MKFFFKAKIIGLRRKTLLGVLVLSLCVIAACSPPPAFVHEIVLETATRTRIDREDVWADGWQIAAGNDQYIDLGPIPEGGVLRCSFLEDAQTPMSVKATVYAGESRVASLRSTSAQQWAIHRVDLARYGGQAFPCRIRFECAGEFVVGQCEVRVPTAQSPNILIFMIDTLRLDHMGCYGYSRDTSPMVDAFAKEAITFTQLMPQSSWTRPSVASLFTGTYPSTHGAMDVMSPLRKNLPSLARSLEAVGYETHAFVSNPNCLPDMNMGTDFNLYRDVYCDEWKEANDAKLVDEVIRVLPRIQDRPWLVYAHVMGPHGPYFPPEGYAERFTALPPSTTLSATQQDEIDRYDAEIAYTDQQFGRLLEALKAQGQYDNTVIMVVSDHGEEFWEHGGTDHGKTLYEEQLRVPFILKLPGGHKAGEQREALVEMVDVAPTLLTLAGATVDSRMQGQSLAPYIETGAIVPRPGYASLYRQEKHAQTAKDLQYKYLIDLKKKESYYFDLVKDPAELQPLERLPEAGEILMQHAAQRAAQGESGLHVLFTKAPGKSHEILCEITHEDLGAYGLDFPHDRGTARYDAEQNRVCFSITLTDIRDETIRELWEFNGKVDVAHAFVKLPVTARPTLKLRVDGTVMPLEQVHAGATKSPLSLQGEALDLEAITALTSDFEQVHTARAFGVYVWFQPALENLSEASLSEERRDALEGLGYL